MQPGPHVSKWSHGVNLWVGGARSSHDALGCFTGDCCLSKHPIRDGQVTGIGNGRIVLGCEGADVGVDGTDPLTWRCGVGQKVSWRPPTRLSEGVMT